MAESIIETLRADHRRMSELLTVIERQIDDLAAGGSPDFELLSDALTYCCLYPNLLHHAYEDGIVVQLGLRAKEEPDCCARLSVQHGTLAGLARHLSALLDRVGNEAELDRSVILDPARRFIALYREHMRHEEEAVYPLAKRTLWPGDWQTIAVRAGNGRQGQIAELKDLQQRVLAWAAA